jgi:hypothetical protein
VTADATLNVSGGGANDPDHSQKGQHAGRPVMGGTVDAHARGCDLSCHQEGGEAARTRALGAQAHGNGGSMKGWGRDRQRGL